MSSFLHSNQAIETLPIFHRKKHIIYVEEREDKLFWANLFEKFKIINIHIKIAGCKSEIIKIIKEIEDYGLEVIVACDCDYDILLSVQSNNPKIIYTHGYSIENTLYCPGSLSKMTSRFCYTLDINKYEEIFIKWFEKFSNDCKDLLIYDLANEKSKKYTKIMGDKSQLYVKTNNPSEISITKVRDRIKKISSKFSKNEIEICRQLIENDKKEIRYLIRGHFLTYAVINQIKKIIRQKTGDCGLIPLETLFISTIDNCLNCQSRCEELKYYENNILSSVS